MDARWSGLYEHQVSGHKQRVERVLSASVVVEFLPINSDKRVLLDAMIRAQRVWATVRAIPRPRRVRRDHWVTSAVGRVEGVVCNRVLRIMDHDREAELPQAEEDLAVALELVDAVLGAEPLRLSRSERRAILFGHHVGGSRSRRPDSFAGPPGHRAVGLAA